MMKRYLPIVVLLALFACKTDLRKAVKDSGLVQEKTVNGFVMRMEYMPSADVNLLHFVLNVKESNGASMKAADGNKFSYGLDSLFGLINVTDTIRPVDVVRVANGNIGGVQYMLLFDKPNAFSRANLVLYFKDELFTRQIITFPLKGSAINHIDSLRLKDDN
jgi:hypothetical protein